MEDKLEQSKQEIIKGNGIISKQQTEFKQMKQKFKLKSTVVMQQEQVIQQKQQAIDDLIKNVTEQKKELELASIESKDLKLLNSTLKGKLEEVQESLKSNENLI